MQKLLCRYKDTFPENYEFVFLDVEASALDDGYPIEVAWMSENGEQDTFLIKPMDYWTRTKHWSLDSESIHNIEHGLLMSEGICVISAVERLNSALKGKIILCDALANDGEWLAELHEAADIAPKYMLTDINYWYSHIGRKKALEFVKILSKTNRSVEHRALKDVNNFMEAFKAWNK